MANTTARAHVGGPDPTPASADPDLENYETTDDEADNPGPAPRLNKKEKRKLKRQAKPKSTIASSIPEIEKLKLAPTAIEGDDDSGYQTDGIEPQLSKNKLKKLKKQDQKKQKAAARFEIPFSEPTSNPPKPCKPTSDTSTASSIPPTLSMPPTTHPLLICSLGNPGSQYAKTLHSAGHFVIDVIRERGLYLPFSAGMSGRVSTPNLTSWTFSFPAGYQRETSRSITEGEDDFTLWQSTKLMNVSGPSVKNAWNTFCKQQRGKSPEAQPQLVVLHDELEAQLGKVSVKQGSASPRGHNGLKSCQGSLGGQQWWRIGVGIGRPESREPDVVSKYVLRKMTNSEERTLDKAAVDVLGALRKIAEGKV